MEKASQLMHFFPSNNGFVSLQDTVGLVDAFICFSMLAMV